jgi:translation initiation factor IF-1
VVAAVAVANAINNSLCPLAGAASIQDVASSLFQSRCFFFMEEHIEVEGRILTVLAGTMFRVELDNKHQVLATISGKMRKKFVRLTSGDRVKMEMSQYDLNKARIVWRIG